MPRSLYGEYAGVAATKSDMHVNRRVLRLFVCSEEQICVTGIVFVCNVTATEVEACTSVTPTASCTRRGCQHGTIRYVLWSVSGFNLNGTRKYSIWVEK